MAALVFPVVCCDDLDAARVFYCRLLGLEVGFESGWYTTLRAPDGDEVQLGFVEIGHPSVPALVARRASGVLISVVVPDVDEVHQRALAMGAEIVWSLQNERFGQRHFMVADPTGLVVDVITEIKPTREFLLEVVRWRRANR